MEKIKLVIWDLDDTFWSGTLSEGGIVPIEENIIIVKELTGRGIINTIVSKNDYEVTKAKLEELGIWDFFVFPHIAWIPKGQQIASIIEKFQLRAKNILFIDDNHLNIQEAKFYNPDLQTAQPDFIPRILSHESFKGKDDSDHSRLKDYKLLELKDKAKLQFSDNKEFLESSDIRLTYNKNVTFFNDRIYELIERTNQLNFTKIRISEQSVTNLTKDPRYQQAVITVQDKFGDYGIVGYYCLDIAQNKLIHFIFSCRILNLGIEQRVYADLGFPDIDIVEEVVSALNKVERPEWIKTSVAGNTVKTSVRTSKQVNVFFKGGCDLSQLSHYLQKFNINFIEEVNWVTSKNIPVHAEHSQILVDSLTLSDDNKQYLIDRIPFIDKKVYATKIFDANYDVLVFSVLMDYTNELYCHKTRSLSIPYGGYYDYLTDQTRRDQINQQYQTEGLTAINSDFFDFFNENFEFTGQITTQHFVDNLKIIRSKIPSQIPIIFVNGAELPSPEAKESNALERHKLMNKALEDFVSDSQNTYILDVRKIVNRPEDITNNIRHYTREKYQQLAGGLLQSLIEAGFQLKEEKQRVSLKKLVKLVLKKCKSYLKISFTAI